MILEYLRTKSRVAASTMRERVLGLIKARAKELHYGLRPNFTSHSTIAFSVGKPIHFCREAHPFHGKSTIIVLSEVYKVG